MNKKTIIKTLTMKYSVQNPIHELYSDGLIYAKKANNEKDRLKRYRYLRISIVMLLASVEAVLHNFWEREITGNPNVKNEIFNGKELRQITTEEKWKQFLKHKFQPFDPSSPKWQSFNNFNKTRHEIIHYKGDAETFYKKLEKQMKSYVTVAKEIFLVIYGGNVMNDWHNNIKYE